MTVAPVRNPIFVTLSDGSIRNTYDIRLRNKHGESRLFGLSLKAYSDLKLEVEGSPGTSVPVPADETLQVRVYVVAPPNNAAAHAERTDLRFWVTDLLSSERTHVDSVFHGKEE
jgi:hypothetical protein